MRSTTSKTFAWIIVFILVIGLAGFGIQDVLRSSNQNEVASFGNQKISSNDYVRMIQQELRNVSKQVGTNISFSQAQSIGVPRIALQKLISFAILDQTLEDIGISQNDDSLREAITNNKAFLDIIGRFSSEKYRDVLLNINLQPNEYEEILRKELSRNLFVELTSTQLDLDREFGNRIVGFFLEERIANVIIIRDKDLKDVVSVSNSEIQSFYNEFPELFTQQETQKISYIYLSPDEIIPEQDVSEEEIRQAYEADRDKFNSPEKRELDQLFFDNENDAINALKTKSSKFVAFEHIMDTRGLTKKDVSVGEVTTDALPKNVQIEVFSASEKDILGPFKTELGYAIYRVNKVIPATNITFLEAFPEINKKIARVKASQELDKLRTRVNDELAAGSTLEEIGLSTKMVFGNLNVYSGASLPDFASGVTFNSLLRSAKSYGSDVTFDEKGGILSLRVDETIGPFVKDFDTVVEIATQEALKKKTAAQLEQKAKEIIANEISKGISFREIANEERYELIEKKNLKRFDLNENLPKTFPQKVFSMNKGEQDIISTNEGVFIFEVEQIIPVSLASSDASTLKKQISSQFLNSLEQDIFNALIENLGKEHSLSISQKAVNTANSRFE